MLDTKALAAATAAIVKEHVDKAVAPLLARIGELELVSVRAESGPQGEPGTDGKDGEKGETGADGKDGRDGADIVDILIDRAGELVATLSDGRIKNIGRVVGRNGKDGAPGKDGRDGFGFDDMTEELADDGRTIIRRYFRGEDVKEFRHKLAVVLYRGVWKEGQTYDAGDNVTWGGHSWIAKEDTDAKPEPNGGPWILHVKRGRDGKDGVLKAEKPKEPVKVG